MLRVQICSRVDLCVELFRALYGVLERSWTNLVLRILPNHNHFAGIVLGSLCEITARPMRSEMSPREIVQLLFKMKGM